MNAALTNARRQVARTKGALNCGGTLLRGTQTHTNRKRPPAKTLRQQFRNAHQNHD